MKKTYFIISMLLLTCLLCNSVCAQKNKNEKKVTVSYTWTHIQSHGSNQIAIWIEDAGGKYICTLFATRFTAKGGFNKRPVSLSEWTSKSDIKNATTEEVDAVTGATPSSGKQSVSWNLTDRKGKAVPAGTYIVRMEANILDSDKMFYHAKIKIGGADLLTKGEITFSKPELANGNVLFSNVEVEYR